MVSNRISRLKCDRQVPCTTCAKNGIESSCNYAARAANGHERRDEESRASEAHVRLQKLEEMVTSLMQRTADGPGGPNSDRSPSSGTIEQSIGSLRVDRTPHSINGHSKSHSDYQGGTHWSTILENVGCSPPKVFVCVT
jgi:hypothetical protein